MREVARVIAHHGKLIVEESTYNYLFTRDNITKIGLIGEWSSLRGANLDLAVVVGGDGTMLEAARNLYNIPLIGVNMGRLGFITDLPRVGAAQVIDLILRDWAAWDRERSSDGPVPAYPKNVTLERRALIHAERDNVSWGDALNDIVISKTGGRILEFKVFVDEKFAYKVRADGLIISTPTGSTAYAYSAGGSILSPGSHTLQLIPMMPQTRSYSPLIISDRECVRVEMVAGEARIWADGIDSGTIVQPDLVKPAISRNSSWVNVCRSFHDAVFVHPHFSDLDYEYFQTLREKLNWHLEPGTR